MTVTKKLSSALLIALLVVCLVLPMTAARADGSITVPGDRTVTLSSGTDNETLTLNASMTGGTQTTIQWTINNTSAVTFDDGSGVFESDGSGTGNTEHALTLKAIGPGTATISGRESGGTGGYATFKVTVKKEFKISLVSKTDSGLTIGGASGSAVMKVEPAGYTNYYDIKWESSDNDIVSVSGNGLNANYAPKTKVGTAQIKATIVPKSGYSDIIVPTSASFDVATTSTQPYLELTKSPTSEITEYNYPGTVHLTLHNDNSVFLPGSDITWSISDSDVLSFSGDATLSGQEANGSFTTKHNGTCTITATVRGNDGSKISDSVKITVNKKLPYLELTGDSRMSASNRNLTLRVKLYDNDTNTYDGDERIKWKSSDTKRVSIVSHDSHLDDYIGEVVVRSHYNTDKVRISVWMADNDDISTYHTVYVTGLSYLPQTGQDSTILYIVGAACVAMFAAAGILIARRKRKTNA